MVERTLDKVTAFVTRDTPGSRQILVFRHPNPAAGVQLPAGTVDPGEDVEQAALREAYEESGIESLRIVRFLGTQRLDLEPGEFALFRDAPLRQAPLLSAPPQPLALRTDSTLKRGAYLSLIRQEGDWAEVTFEDHDPHSDPPHQSVCTTGWIAEELLAPSLLRYFYQLVPTAPTPERWEHLAEGRLIFTLYWLPLVPKPQLSNWSTLWLYAVYDQLVS